MQAMMHMAGLNIVTSNHLPKFKMVQFRFPRSKSKRIRLKWSKRDENFKQVPIENHAYVFGNTIVVDPETAISLNRQLNRGSFVSLSGLSV